MYQSRWPNTEAPSTSKQAPPPSKPLPPIPRPVYFMLLESPLDTSLLSHPVPSPSLYADEMMSHSMDKAYHNPRQPIIPSSTQDRDSTVSLMEFVEALLPPTPNVAQHVASTEGVECYVIDSRLPRTPTTTPASERVATPDQLDQLCYEMGQHQVQRRDSAMFDTTQTVPRALSRPDSDLGCHTLSPPSTASDHRECLVASVRSSVVSHPRSSSATPTEDSNSERGQTSFIDWDEEVSRLAKVKKSFADLKTAARARSNSAPLVTVQACLPTADRQMSVQSDPMVTCIKSTTKRPRSSGRRSIVVVRPRSPLNTKKDNTQSPRIMTISNTKRTPSMRQPKTIGSSTAMDPAPPSFEERRDSFVGPCSKKRRRGLDNLSCWMRKVMRLS